jgi:hypothetical protein
MTSIEEYANTILNTLSGDLYISYMAHIDKAMDEYKKSGTLKGALEGFLVVSGDSLLAAKYRELCNSSFERKESVLVGIEKQNIKELYYKLSNKKIKNLKRKLGVPVLFLYKGDHLLRHLNFDINTKLADIITENLEKAVGIENLEKVIKSFKEYNLLLKEKKERNESDEDYKL